MIRNRTKGLKAELANARAWDRRFQYRRPRLGRGQFAVIAGVLFDTRNNMTHKRWVAACEYAAESLERQYPQLDKHAFLTACGLYL